MTLPGTRTYSKQLTVLGQAWCYLCLKLYLPWSHRDSGTDKVPSPFYSLHDPERRVRVNGRLQRPTWETTLSFRRSLETCFTFKSSLCGLWISVRVDTVLPSLLPSVASCQNPPLPLLSSSPPPLPQSDPPVDTARVRQQRNTSPPAAVVKFNSGRVFLERLLFGPSKAYCASIARIILQYYNFGYGIIAIIF